MANSPAALLPMAAPMRSGLSRLIAPFRRAAREGMDGRGRKTLISRNGIDET